MASALEAPSDTVVRQVEKNVRHATGGLVRGLKVQMSDGQIVISGRASTYYTKQLVTHAALSVLDELALQNDVSVS